jgi:hypothetical protein
MATIYSDQFKGVGTIAGSVYYCSLNHYQEKLAAGGMRSFLAYEAANMWPVGSSGGAPAGQLMIPSEANPTYQSISICMLEPTLSHRPKSAQSTKDAAAQNVPMDLDFVKDFEKQGLIASTRNISNQRVFIGNGKNDTMVRAEAAAKLEEFYTRLGVRGGSLKVEIGDGAHNFPTDRTDDPDTIGCNEQTVPFIANCGNDLAGKILKHVTDKKLTRGKFQAKNLRVLSQSRLASGDNDSSRPKSIADYGYLYANDTCMEKPETCDLHVALHGCEMADSFDLGFQNSYLAFAGMTQILGMSETRLLTRHPQYGTRTFATKAGYSEYAEPAENHLMVLFPQTFIGSDNFPANPFGCWDWYGWTGADYATNRGAETQWLMGFIKRAKENPKALVVKATKDR